MLATFLDFFRTITFGYPGWVGLSFALLILAMGFGFSIVTSKLSAIKKELDIQQVEIHAQVIDTQDQLRDVHKTLKQVKRDVPFKIFEMINKSLLKQVETFAAFILGLVLRTRSTLTKLFSFSLLKEVFKQIKKIEWYRF